MSSERPRGIVGVYKVVRDRLMLSAEFQHGRWSPGRRLCRSADLNKDQNMLVVWVLLTRPEGSEEGSERVVHCLL